MIKNDLNLTILLAYDQYKKLQKKCKKNVIKVKTKRPFEFYIIKQDF